MRFFYLFISLWGILPAPAQHRIDLQAKLDDDGKILQIRQVITYRNTSGDTLKQLYFHDWNHAFSGKYSTLGKRMLEEHRSKLFFAPPGKRGSTNIKSVRCGGQDCRWQRYRESTDILEVTPEHHLPPGDSLTLEFHYDTKIPHASFTGYGYTKKGYALRYWYLIPAPYSGGKWQLKHHRDLDDMICPDTGYHIRLELPEKYRVESHLKVHKTNGGYELSGNSTNDISLYISDIEKFERFTNGSCMVLYRLPDRKLDKELRDQLLNRQVAFLDRYFGDTCRAKMILTRTSERKHPIAGSQLIPGFLNPFPPHFLWETGSFNLLVHEYLSAFAGGKTSGEYWLAEGTATYLLQKYLDTYYPGMTLAGRFSDLPLIRKYEFARKKFGERLYYGYAYNARFELDQAPSTPPARLTPYNRLIGVPAKTALGLAYLEEMYGSDLLRQSLSEYWKIPAKERKISGFQHILQRHTGRSPTWFFDGWIHTTGKFDYSLRKIHSGNPDKKYFRIRNKTGWAAPYRISVERKDSLPAKAIEFPGTRKTDTLTIPPENHRIVLSPALDIRRKDNYQMTRGDFFKPLKIRLFGDFDDPESNQLFINPVLNYNYYNGWTPALDFTNKTLLRKNFLYRISPAYGTKSHSIAGSFHIRYLKYFPQGWIHGIKTGWAGSYYHYDTGLAYRKTNLYARLLFRRKNLRSTRYRSWHTSFVRVLRETDETLPEENDYAVTTTRYVHFDPQLINRKYLSVGIEYERRFVKWNAEIRYRRLMRNNRHWDIRLFAGAFLKNNTHSDYFSFGTNRPHDYLFRYRYYGRSETSGIWNQQVVIHDGGFIAEMPVPYADQWLISSNMAFTLWKKLELYANTGWAKNRGYGPVLLYDQGLRLNIIDRILEIYFPVYSNNGFETGPHYERKIRFVLDMDVQTLFNYISRGKL